MTSEGADRVDSDPIVAQCAAVSWAGSAVGAGADPTTYPMTSTTEISQLLSVPGSHLRRLPTRYAVLAAVLALVAAGCSAPKQARNSRVSVTVARVERRAVALEIRATGTVEPIQTAAVGSQVGGVITRIAFREGDEVGEGQLLIQLDARPFRAALQQASANLMRDQAQARTARRDADRADQLLRDGAIAAAEHDRTVSTAEALEGTVRGDSAAVSTARLNLEYASIRSPISGRTGRLNVHEGDLVKAATSDPLVTVNRLRPIRVRFTVPQSQLAQVQRYRNAHPRVMVRPSDADSVEIEGALAFVDNAVDEANGTLLLKGEFANADHKLWPGEFVEVRLVLANQADATVVPAPAIASGQQGTYVYVLNADSTATARPVVVDRTDDVTAVVSKGLVPGETVITDGQFRLGPGSRVVVRGARNGTQP